MTHPSAVSRAARTYETNDIEAADPLSLVARVFDEALRNLAQARSALAAGDMSAKGARVHRAARCLGVLQGALDMEQGGEVARNLDRLYSYLQGRLTAGHLRNDDELLGEVAGHLESLAGAWRQVSRPGPRAAVAAR